MPNPFTRLFLGSGTFPASARPVFEQEQAVVLWEGRPGHQTFRNFRAPRHRAGFERQWMRLALAVTDVRLAVYGRRRPLVDVPFTDPRFDALEISASDKGLLIANESSIFNNRMSGRVEVFIELDDAAGVLATIHAQRAAAAG